MTIADRSSGGRLATLGVGRQAGRSESGSAQSLATLTASGTPPYTKASRTVCPSRSRTSPPAFGNVTPVFRRSKTRNSPIASSDPEPAGKTYAGPPTRSRMSPARSAGAAPAFSNSIHSPSSSPTGSGSTSLMRTTRSGGGDADEDDASASGSDSGSSDGSSPDGGSSSDSGSSSVGGSCSIGGSSSGISQWT